MPPNVERTRRLTRPEIMRAAMETGPIHGWLCHREKLESHDPHTGRPDGFPPLALVRDGSLLLLFPVFHTRRLTAPQRRWLEALSQVPGVTVEVIGPGNLHRLLCLLREPAHRECATDGEERGECGAPDHGRSPGGAA